MANTYSTKPKIGDKVRDVLTGFTGIVVARTEYLFDRPRIGIQPPELRSGRIIQVEWFDETRIDVLEPGRLTPTG